MKTIRIELDGELSEEMDRMARETGRGRSGLLRDALREQLRRWEMEERDRAGYAANPPATGESSAWEAAAAWPEE